MRVVKSGKSGGQRRLGGLAVLLSAVVTVRRTSTGEWAYKIYNARDRKHAEDYRALCSTELPDVLHGGFMLPEARLDLKGFEESTGLQFRKFKPMHLPVRISRVTSDRNLFTRLIDLLAFRGVEPGCLPELVERMKAAFHEGCDAELYNLRKTLRSILAQEFGPPLPSPCAGKSLGLDVRWTDAVRYLHTCTLEMVRPYSGTLFPLRVLHSDPFGMLNEDNRCTLSVIHLPLKSLDGKQVASASLLSPRSRPFIPAEPIKLPLEDLAPLGTPPSTPASPDEPAAKAGREIPKLRTSPRKKKASTDFNPEISFEWSCVQRPACFDVPPLSPPRESPSLQPAVLHPQEHDTLPLCDLIKTDLQQYIFPLLEEPAELKSEPLATSWQLLGESSPRRLYEEWLASACAALNDSECL